MISCAAQGHRQALERPARYGDDPLARVRTPDLVQSDAVQTVCEVLASLGVDPTPVLVQAGIAPRSRSAVSFASIGRLTALAARAAQCPHLGLLVGGRTSLASLGPLGVRMRHSETVGDALRALERHHACFNRGAVVGLVVFESIAILHYAPCQPGLSGVALQCERALAALTAVLRALTGEAWSPEEVLLPRSEPEEVAPYARLFRAPIRFEQEIAALVLPVRLLAQPIEGADPHACRAAEQRIAELEAAAPIDIKDDLRRRLRATMIQRQLSPRQVAQTMAIHRRTLSRRLRAEGTSLRHVVDETRCSLAKQLLADTGLSLTQISATIDFSEPAAFTHAFRRWTGTTPSAWRKAQRSS